MNLSGKRQRLGGWRKDWAAAGLLLCGTLAGAGPAQAETPRVVVDWGYAVPCQEILDQRMVGVAEDERLYEARFRLSMVVTDGSEADLDGVTIVIESPSRRLRIIDYAPQTRLASDVISPIDVVENRQSATSFEGGLNGVVQAPCAPITATLTPHLAAKHMEQSNVQQSFKRQAPQSLVVASGTIRAEQGVFFKLTPSPFETLQGAREFTCRFAVPQEWRGDWITITAQVRLQRRWYEHRGQQPRDWTRATVALYRADDATARNIALRAAKFQGELMDRCGAHQGKRVDVGELLARVAPPEQAKERRTVVLRPIEGADPTTIESLSLALRSQLLQIGSLSGPR